MDFFLGGGAVDFDYGREGWHDLYSLQLETWEFHTAEPPWGFRSVPDQTKTNQEEEVTVISRNVLSSPGFLPILQPPENICICC